MKDFFNRGLPTTTHISNNFFNFNLGKIYNEEDISGDSLELTRMTNPSDTRYLPPVTADFIIEKNRKKPMGIGFDKQIFGLKRNFINTNYNRNIGGFIFNAQQSEVNSDLINAYIGFLQGFEGQNNSEIESEPNTTSILGKISDEEFTSQKIRLNILRSLKNKSVELSIKFEDPIFDNPNFKFYKSTELFNGIEIRRNIKDKEKLKQDVEKIGSLLIEKGIDLDKIIHEDRYDDDF